ncbi:hypothetical protein SAMN04515666_101336 [Bosea lupini]|uniref:Uncharacterized protein n=1 Tax=Bosea lupini TaxID=1036779 RepID=A0A1H7GGL2_9HYPH|nr:hypothetical protein [Bosea lupini]SEK36667.1 hypothetical protein SAMN04515666_101336 [Bosea lupini]
MVIAEKLDVTVEAEDRELKRRDPVRTIVAQCAGLTLGFAVYEAALQRWPHDRLMLRHGARVIRDTHPQPREDFPGR